MWKNAMILLLCFLPFGLKAQVVYDDYFLFQQNNVVLIHWTVKSGSLCNGTTVYRKNPGGSDVEVAYIEGICGSDVEDVSYSVFDSDPLLNSDNTYYIQFGFGEYSEAKTINVRYLDPKELYISPNPVTTEAKIEWNDEFHEIYTLEVINQYGQKVTERTEIQGNSVILPMESFARGSYVVKLTSPNGKELLRKMEKL